MNTGSQDYAHSPEEMHLLALLREVQSTLTAAINSLDEHSFRTPEAHYLAWAAVAVNRAADGYLVLRESYRVDTSKLLIRPILEAVFSASAATAKRGFLFRKAYTEMLEEKKFHPKTAAVDADFQDVLKKTERLFKDEDPNYPIEHKKVDMCYTAQVAGMLPAYEVAYRTYCQFAHGAISAVSGQLNVATDELDTQIVIRWVIILLELLKKHTPANVPDFTPILAKLPTPR